MRLLGEKGTDGRTYCIGSGKARPLKEYIDIILRQENVRSEGYKMSLVRVN